MSFATLTFQIFTVINIRSFIILIFCSHYEAAVRLFFLLDEELQLQMIFFLIWSTAKRNISLQPRLKVFERPLTTVRKSPVLPINNARQLILWGEKSGSWQWR